MYYMVHSCICLLTSQHHNIRKTCTFSAGHHVFPVIGAIHAHNLASVTHQVAGKVRMAIVGLCRFPLLLISARLRIRRRHRLRILLFYWRQRRRVICNNKKKKKNLIKLITKTTPNKCLQKHMHK